MELHRDVWFAAPAKLATSSATNGNLPVRRGAGRHWNDKGALRMMFGMRVRGGSAGRSDHVRRAGGRHAGGVLVSVPAAAQTVASIAVEGNRRVEVETIRSYFKPGPGGRARAGPDRRRPEGADRNRPVPGRENQPGGRPAGRDRGRKPGDRAHRLRGQQEGQGRAAFGGNPVQAARHAVAPDGSVGRPAHRRNLPPLRPL